MSWYLLAESVLLSRSTDGIGVKHELAQARDGTEKSDIEGHACRQSRMLRAYCTNQLCLMQIVKRRREREESGAELGDDDRLEQDVDDEDQEDDVDLDEVERRRAAVRER